MMSLPSPHSIHEECAGCGLVLDVAQEGVFSLVRCPQCRSEVRVKSLLCGYVLLDLLGEGGSGRVFLAEDPASGERIAIKFLDRRTPDYEGHLVLMRNEAECARLINHPRVVRVLDFRETTEGAVLPMELMDGGSLHDLITEEAPVAEERVLAIGLQIVKALSASQEKGFIHRDIKPANILFGGTGGAKLGDFGLARGKNAKPVPERHLLATPDYVAPEVLGRSRGDLRSDIYSLGSTLFHALAANPPYVTDGLSIPELAKLKKSSVKIEHRRGDLSRPTRILINRMIAPEPVARFASYPELEQAFLAALHALESPAPSGVPGFLGKASVFFKNLRG